MTSLRHAHNNLKSKGATKCNVLKIPTRYLFLFYRFDVPIHAWVSEKIDKIVSSNIIPVNGIKTFSKDYGKSF